MKMKLQAIWEYGFGPECVQPLLDGNPTPESICLDKDPIATAVLRLALDAKNITPSQDLKIHCWKTTHTDGVLFHFVDDEQNNLLKAKYTTACNT